MFSHPKILFLVSLLFVALLNSIPTYLFEFLILFNHSSLNSTFYGKGDDNFIKSKHKDNLTLIILDNYVRVLSL